MELKKGEKLWPLLSISEKIMIKFQFVGESIQSILTQEDLL